MSFKVGDLVRIVDTLDERYFLRRGVSKGDVFTIVEFYEEGHYYIKLGGNFSVCEKEVALCVPNNALSRAVYPDKVPHPKFSQYLVDK